MKRKKLSKPGKDFQGHKLLRQHLTPGTDVMLSDENIYSVTEEEWDGVFVPVVPRRKGKFHKADINLIKLVDYT